MLTSKTAWRTVRSGLVDPLAWLSRELAHVALVDGAVQLTFESVVRREKRTKLYAFAARYDLLLRMQLDVPPGERPRTVQQLLAAGRIKIHDGKYVRA